MNRLLFKFALAAAVAVGAGAVGALEFKDKDKASAAPAAEVKDADAKKGSASQVETDDEEVEENAKPAPKAKKGAPANKITDEDADESMADDEEFVEEEDGALAQDQKYKDKANPGPKKSTESALKQITDIFTKEFKPWDSKTGRIAVTVSTKFDVPDPEVDSSFLELRAAKMTELLLRAKAAIATTMMTEMDAERVLEIPGNPIAKQLNEETEKVEKAIVKAKKALAEAGIKVDEAKFDVKSMTLPEVMASVTTIFKESNNYASKLDKDKKKRYEAAKKTYQAAEAEYKALVEKAKVIKEDLADKLERKTESSIKMASQMQLHGCSILEQADSCGADDDGNYQYEIAVIYTWSREAEKAAEAVLSAKTMKCNKSGKSINQWVEHFAKNGGLSDWMGPRTYIDGQGQMWFIGIASSPVKRNANAQDKQVQSAALRARAEVGYALYADVFTTSQLEELSIDLDINGKTASKQFSDYSEKTAERFSKLKMYGLTKLGQYQLKHTATDQDINVLVYGINSANAADLKKCHAAAHKAGIRINFAQQFEEGRVARMRQQNDLSKNSPAMRKAGSDVADDELKGSFTPAGKKSGDEENVNPATTPAGSQQRGRLKRGGRMVRGSDF